MNKKIRNCWNYETCKKAALKCKNRSEFWKNFSAAATLCSKNNWLNDFFPPNTKKPSGYWTFEKCAEESKKYKYYTEFRDNSFTVYNKCKKNGWIKSFIWLVNNLKKYDLISPIHLVYSYEFSELGYVYVGRTFQLAQRDYTHKHPKNNKKDGVFEFCKENEVKFPEPIILEEKLTLTESKIKEKYWCDIYEKKGFKLINKAKTGERYSSVGGIATKWDKEACYNEAKKYTRKIDFYKKSNSAWVSARKHGWLSSYDWLLSKKKNIWTYNECLNAAKSCSKLTEFREKFPQAYRKAANKKWVASYDWLYRERKFWTEEEIKTLISNCSSKVEFKKKHPKAWHILANHKWYHLWDLLKKQ